MPWEIVKPVFDLSVRQLCLKPYPGHPKGCQNYGAKEGCPPAARPIFDLLDPARPIWAVWNKYDLAGHVDRMKAKHPNWSWRQLVCCRYWQPTARKNLAEECVRMLADADSFLVIVSCPEACGVNVTATMAAIGIDLEWPPTTTTYQVVLAGTLRGTSDA